MNRTETRPEARAIRASDPPVDFSREEAAYERERSGLIREHAGRIALVHDDDVIGVFSSADEAIAEGCRRFGTDQIMVKEIRDPDPPDFIPLVDINHPSFKRLE